LDSGKLLQKAKTPLPDLGRGWGRGINAARPKTPLPDLGSNGANIK